MFKKNIKPILMAGALALATAVSPVLATGGNDTQAKTVPDVQNNNHTVTIYKTVEWAYGATFNGGVKFNITNVTDDAPDANISYGNSGESLNFTNSDVEATDFGTVSKTKTATLSFGTFQHAGEYIYTLTEADDGITDNSELTNKAGTPKSYKIRVYVVNNGDALTIRQITAQVLNSNGSEGQKAQKVQFNNEFKEPGGNLTISKNVSGNFADKTKDFTFKITLIAPAISDVTNSSTEGDETIPGDTVSGYIGDDQEVFTYGEEKTVELHHGESLVFTGLPAGTQYTVTEVEARDGYAPSYKVTVGNTEDIANEADGNNLTVTKVLTDAGATVAYTNTYADSNNPITGVIVNNMPYIALLGASGAGLVVLAASKKRSKK